MRLTAENKSRITERIAESAAQAFREQGYEQVNLDRIMQGAGLTRGAFYAHFKSKADIFNDVVRHRHPILRMLQDRPGPGAAELGAQMMQIFADYLTPAHLDIVFRGCTVAALTGDVTRGSQETRAAYETGFNAILNEMARGQNAPPEAFGPPFVLASGALRTAAAMADDTGKSELLQRTHRTFELLMNSIFEEETRS